MQVLHGYMHFK